MGQVYPWVGLDCVGLGQKFSTFNNRVGMAPIAKSVLKYINIYFYCISTLFASFFSGLVLFAGKYGTIGVNISTNYLLMNRESLNNKSGTCHMTRG